MSFRISVESVICRYPQAEVLLVKRAPGCKVAPGVWNVPAGKVDMLETTQAAVVRETREETTLTVEVVKLLAEHAFEIKVGDQPAYRNMFTFLTKPLNGTNVVIDREHTEFRWVTKEQLGSDTFSSLSDRLRGIILKELNDSSTD